MNHRYKCKRQDYKNLEHIGFADEFLGVTDIAHEKN